MHRSLPTAARRAGWTHTSSRAGRRAVVIALALATISMLCVPTGSAAAGVPNRVRATQELAILLTAHSAHKAPEAASPQVALLAARRPITGEQTTVPVLDHWTGAEGVQWLQVMLPGRPNGSTGWIAKQATRRLLTAWHLVVDLAARRVSAYRDGRVVRTFQAVVGKPSTPTPTGQFFVEETVQMPAGEAGGPFALALSARSDALQEFEGGPGQIAMHGREHLGGTLGSAASHGCVRLATASISWLAARIGPGTPASIYAG